MSELKFRVAEPKDAEAFSQWLTDNPLVDRKDIDAALMKNNPTTIFFAVEDQDGKVIMFAPFYCSLVAAYLGFNPEADADERKQALQYMLDGAMAFAVQFGVREITTMSKENYPVARWALTHGFDVDSRQQLKFDINKVLAVAAGEVK